MKFKTLYGYACQTYPQFEAASPKNSIISHNKMFVLLNMFNLTYIFLNYVISD
ncbi:unnamed protein product, partial [Vitis vinifera]|uniref:Uncharacterized protein n=1 Tax=Vitis vinifera TaxID=29760 RepID=D7TIQ0_VITVI